MRIAGQSTIVASERSLIELDRAIGDEPLKLPTRVRHLVGGAEAALAQVIVTWAQRTTHRRLETFITSANDEQLLDLVRRFAGLIAALCADEIVGATPGTDLTDAVTRAALGRLEQLRGPKPSPAYRGPSAEVVCVDHIGRGTPYMLYQPSPKGGAELRSRENFRALAGWLLRRAVPLGYREMLDPSVGDAIGGMLYEVFKNTEDHARVDARGNLLSTSIRALKTNRFDVAPDDLLRIVEDFPPLAEYCRSLAAPAGGVQTHLFELSVLDSGPGFAPTWTRRPLEELTDREEEQAVRECFGRGSTKGGSRFGEGLPHVLRVLRKERGFLRLRTGRISLYVDYSDSDHAPEAQALQRFKPAQGRLAPVSGSLLTLIIPLRRGA